MAKSGSKSEFNLPNFKLGYQFFLSNPDLNLIFFTLGLARAEPEKIRVPKLQVLDLIQVKKIKYWFHGVFCVYLAVAILICWYALYLNTKSSKEVRRRQQREVEKSKVAEAAAKEIKQSTGNKREKQASLGVQMEVGLTY